MTDTKRTVGNLILFGGAIFLSGWVGLLTDRLTGQPAPTSLNDYLTGGELPRLVLPLLTVVALRAVAGGWQDAGFAPNLRGAGATYLLLILAYPTALAVALIIGFLANAISFSTLHATFYLEVVARNLPWLLVTSLVGETLWRGYLANQLLKLRLRSWQIYLIVAGVWWVWWLPFWGIMVINNSHIAEFNVTGANMAVATIPMFLCWTVFYTEAFRATRSIWPGVITQVFMNAVILQQFAAEIASPNLIVLGLLPAAFLCVIGLLVGRATTTPAQHNPYVG
jgi:putative membrane protein